jgi:hypothetical protein
LDLAGAARFATAGLARLAVLGFVRRPDANRVRLAVFDVRRPAFVLVRRATFRFARRVVRAALRFGRVAVRRFARRVFFLAAARFLVFPFMPVSFLSAYRPQRPRTAEPAPAPHTQFAVSFQRTAQPEAASAPLGRSGAPRRLEGV